MSSTSNRSGQTISGRAAGGVTWFGTAGAKPANLPVEQPATYELIVNLKTAKALGIKIPAVVMLRASEVIE